MGPLLSDIVFPPYNPLSDDHPKSLANFTLIFNDFKQIYCGLIFRFRTTFVNETHYCSGNHCAKFNPSNSSSHSIFRTINFSFTLTLLGQMTTRITRLPSDNSFFTALSYPPLIHFTFVTFALHLFLSRICGTTIRIRQLTKFTNITAQGYPYQKINYFALDYDQDLNHVFD